MPKKLKIHYDGYINQELDNALEECLKKFGYKRWASGIDLQTKVRDLAFDKKEASE